MARTRPPRPPVSPGRLLPGYRADITAFTLDPLTATPDELAESPIP